MLDQPAASHRRRLNDGPRLDFQEHLADLEAKGLLVRIDRAINKDTELHPLVRLAIPGRRPRGQAARLPVHQCDGRQGPSLRYPGRGRRARGLARDLCHRHGAAGRQDRRSLDAGHRRSHCAGRRRCAALPGGRAHGRRPQGAGRAGAPAGADLDARLRFRALSDACVRQAPRWAPVGPRSRHPTGWSCAWWRAGEQGWRLSALAQYASGASRCRSRS